MRTQREKGLGRWLRRHLTTIICIVVALIVAGGSIAWIAISTNAYVRQTNAHTEQLRMEATQLTKEAEERRAKEAAEAEEKRVEAAKGLAEQAKTGNTRDIDASVCNASKTHNNVRITAGWRQADKPRPTLTVRDQAIANTRLASRSMSQQTDVHSIASEELHSISGSKIMPLNMDLFSATTLVRSQLRATRLKSGTIAM